MIILYNTSILVYYPYIIVGFPVLCRLSKKDMKKAIADYLTALLLSEVALILFVLANIDVANVTIKSILMTTLLLMLLLSPVLVLSLLSRKRNRKSFLRRKIVVY